MNDEHPQQYVLRQQQEESALPSRAEPSSVPPPEKPKTTIPSILGGASEELYEVIKRAVVDGFSEVMPLLREVITDAMQDSQEIDESEEEPEIPYRSRYDRMKLIVRLAGMLLVVVAISTLFVFLSGQIVPVTALVVFVWALSVTSYVFVRLRSTQFDGKRAAAASKALKTAWAVGVVVALVLLMAVLSFLKVNVALGFVYAVLSLILMYFSAREVYKWSELWIYREGTQLIADRPPSNFFFLKPFHKVLMLQKVTHADIKTTWLDTKLGFDRVNINVEGDDEEEKYWNTLAYIIDGLQLIRSVNQGAQQAR